MHREGSSEGQPGASNSSGLEPSPPGFHKETGGSLPRPLPFQNLRFRQGGAHNLAGLVGKRTRLARYEGVFVGERKTKVLRSFNLPARLNFSNGSRALS